MTLLDQLARFYDALFGPAKPRQGEGPGEGTASRSGGAAPSTAADSPSAHPDGDDPDEPVVMPIEESIDLHHFAPRDVPSVVEEYLHEARKAGFREVRVIHGKGKGVQRRRVQAVLQSHPAVESFRSDGLGSTLVRLAGARPRRTTT